jgi:hypothetical protein
VAESPWQASSLIWDWRGTTDGGAGAAKRRRALQAAARREGAIGGAVGLAVAAAIAFLLHRRGLAAVVASASLLAALVALVAPLTLYRSMRRALDRFGHWIGTAVTWLLMTVLFYLLFLPVGLAMRAAGKLAFTRFADPTRDSYWTSTAGRVHDAASYRKQF